MPVLMKVGDLFTTPKGLVINGTNEKFPNHSELELRNLVLQIGAIHFTTSTGITHQLDLIDTKITTSLGDGHNIHLLVENNSISQLIKVGEAIYYDSRKDRSSMAQSQSNPVGIQAKL